MAFLKLLSVGLLQQQIATLVVSPMVGLLTFLQPLEARGWT